MKENDWDADACIGVPTGKGQRWDIYLTGIPARPVWRQKIGTDRSVPIDASSQLRGFVILLTAQLWANSKIMATSREIRQTANGSKKPKLLGIGK